MDDQLSETYADLLTGQYDCPEWLFSMVMNSSPDKPDKLGLILSRAVIVLRI